MNLAKSSQVKFEEFYREFFEEDKAALPPIKIYARTGAALITKLFKINGITLGRRIIINPRVTTRAVNSRLYAPKVLIAHELAHVLQYQKLGFIKFLYFYLRDYWKALRKKEKWDFNSRMEAYLEIPFEVEARQFAADFLDWLESRQQNADKLNSM